MDGIYNGFPMEKHNFILVFLCWYYLTIKVKEWKGKIIMEGRWWMGNKKEKDRGEIMASLHLERKMLSILWRTIFDPLQTRQRKTGNLFSGKMFSSLTTECPKDYERLQMKRCKREKMKYRMHFWATNRTHQILK